MGILVHVLLMLTTVVVIYFVVSTDEEENIVEYRPSRVVHKPTINVIKQQMAKIAKIRRAKFGP